MEREKLGGFNKIPTKTTDFLRNWTGELRYSRKSRFKNITQSKKEKEKEKPSKISWDKTDVADVLPPSTSARAMTFS